MCGIAGYISTISTSSKIDEKLLYNMQKALVHRGPDDGGIWKSDFFGIGLAHKRLSIVDLSIMGRQPMSDRNENITVSFNGEIYNHRELRKELEALGYKYFSNTDTETLIYAYKEWGIDFIHKLDGMFAISLFDKENNELYLIRDRIGVKPLYFSTQGGFLSFASEIKALWELPWIYKDINNLAVYHYLTFLVSPAPMTLYKGIYKLPAGFYLKVGSDRKLTFSEWYNPLKVEVSDSHKLNDKFYCIDVVREILRDSIKKRMMSDVPFGVFLSGGIDSSLNVALMSEFTTKVKTFNVVFEDGLEYDERKWAKKVSDRFGTEHHEIVVTEKEAFEFYEKMVYHQDEPLADWVCMPLYFVSKLAKDSGVTVVQCGEGADELFCGYDAYGHYLDIYKKYWKPSQYLIPKPIKKVLYSSISRMFPHKGFVDHIRNWAESRNLFWSGAVAFKENAKNQFFLNKEFAEDDIVSQIYSGMSQEFDSYSIVDFHLKNLKKLMPNFDYLQSMTYLELKQRLPELLLMRLDKMTMATSVEGRVPFLDHRLVEIALRIPQHLKYIPKKSTEYGVIPAQTKYILKQACEWILPEEIISRKKIGFAAPVKKWFRKGHYFNSDSHKLTASSNNYLFNNDFLEGILTKHQLEEADLSPQLWNMYNLISFLN
ncbi:asparagine synthase (glutamine-hydrolyzing) [Candidatus Babeliales bacterium]|nr:asparagine synthase (glutamine-hydrolyzing) [Candidatus Babeliales bacterium]